MNITTVGIDLAKNVFSVHGVDAHGKVVLKKTVSRGKLLECFANLPPATIGMEACSGAHHWARALRSLGHDARIIAPRFVVPYCKSGKNDGNDAEAICEAVSRPAMRFVPVKSVEQQAVLSLHRIRSAVVAERTGYGGARGRGVFDASGGGWQRCGCDTESGLVGPAVPV